MKLNRKQLAPWSLYLSLAALLSALVSYLIQRQFSLIVQISLAVVVLGIALFAMLEPQKLREAFTGRQARYASNATILTIAFIGILVVVNYLAYKNSPRWDLTEDKTHTLAPETIDTLKNLPMPVKALAFFSQSAYNTNEAKQLLDSYQYNASDKFSYEFINPDQNPVAVQNANVTRDGTIVLQMGDRQELVTYPTEQEMTSAIIKLIHPENRVLYFLNGHGEKDPFGTTDDSYSTLRSTLESKNYTIQALNLIGQPQIPSNASAIIVAGPITPLSDSEISILKAYLDNGGSVIFLLEPRLLTQQPQGWEPLYQYLESAWGLQLNDSIVVNPNDMFDRVIAIGDPATYANHPITTNLRGLVTLFPTAQAIQTIVTDQPVNTTAIISTNAKVSWAESNISSLEQGNETLDSDDTPGPLAIAVAGEHYMNGARLVVIGDADFAVNAAFYQYGNGDLLVNCIDWANKQESLITLTPKSSTQRTLIPPTTAGMAVIFLAVFSLPVLVIIAGVVVWIQRRRKG